ncbi:phosphoprotein phosphatase 1 domain protein [Oesophagostomum dentatum]|uniref:Serine/threonine-protein phosphatase n=1 Tax=Oesophagostomum dentatum TaxID=61180 RepID=A0A0B1T2S4_OESDE|nr:phosphoprotein phosphatase 1 domain protein [Oesophagostomum dentatum]
MFMQESSLCECEVPVKVVGDIHAQYQDMNRLFDLIGRVPDEKFMFLGDYVDRGPQGIEVVILLFTLKLRYRDRIFLLRGNHETPAVNKIYGFYNECVMKYGAGIWWDFQACFNRIPLAGLISKRVRYSLNMLHLEQFDSKFSFNSIREYDIHLTLAFYALSE